MIRSSRGREQFLEGVVAPLACPIHEMGKSGDQKSQKVDTSQDAPYYDHDMLATRSIDSADPASTLLSSAAASSADWLQRSPLASAQVA